MVLFGDPRPVRAIHSLIRPVDHSCPSSDPGCPRLIGMSLSPEEACGFSCRRYHAVGRRTLLVQGKRLSAGPAGLVHRMSPRGPRSDRKYHALWRKTLCRYGRKRRLAGDLPSHTALAARRSPVRPCGQPGTYQAEFRRTLSVWA
jgi:hypothetical protein